MKHPVRYLFEHLGLVRRPGESIERYAEADKVANESDTILQEVRARRLRLKIETESFRKARHDH